MFKITIHTASVFRGTKLESEWFFFSIEPGLYVNILYVNMINKTVPEEFRGLGIRIEDDVLVGADGKIQILTEDCVKEI